MSRMVGFWLGLQQVCGVLGILVLMGSGGVIGWVNSIGSTRVYWRVQSCCHCYVRIMVTLMVGGLYGKGNTGNASWNGHTGWGWNARCPGVAMWLVHTVVVVSSHCVGTGTKECKTV